MYVYIELLVVAINGMQWAIIDCRWCCMHYMKYMCIHTVLMCAHTCNARTHTHTLTHTHAHTLTLSLSHTHTTHTYTQHTHTYQNA